MLHFSRTIASCLSLVNWQTLMTWAIASTIATITIIWCWCAFLCAICISSHQLKKKRKKEGKISKRLLQVDSLFGLSWQFAHPGGPAQAHTQLADEQAWSIEHGPIKQSIKVIRFNSASLNVYNWQWQCQQRLSNQPNEHTFLLIMQISISLQLPLYLPPSSPSPPTEHTY